MFHVKQSAQQASYLLVCRRRQTSVIPLLRLLPPQPRCWVASEMGEYGILRFRASAKAHPLRRASSSTENRFAGFSVDF